MCAIQREVVVDSNLSSETYLFFLHLITIHALRRNKIFLTKLMSSELANLAWVPKVADINLIFISTSLCSCKKNTSYLSPVGEKTRRAGYQCTSMLAHENSKYSVKQN